MSLNLSLQYYKISSGTSANVFVIAFMPSRYNFALLLVFTHFLVVAPQLSCIYFLLPCKRVRDSRNPASARSQLVNPSNSDNSGSGDAFRDMGHWNTDS